MALILVADDSLIVRKSYESMLSFMGHNVILCKDGKEVVEKFLAERPDLIILDVDMPGMDGLEACRELRRHPEGLSVPIIIVSVLDEEDAIIQGLNAGANDYLVKPVKEAHLMAKLKTSMGISALHRKDFELVKNKTVFVGKYRIEKLLGYGTHSAVFMVSDIANGNRKLALKLLKENFASEDVAAPLLEGARRMMTIESPYVVKIFDIGQFQDRVYMVMEYAEGGCLANLLKGRPMTEFEAVSMGFDLARGLQALDEKDVLHLDVKPANILITADCFKLSDFGVVAPRESATMPLNEEIWSTAAYISPEFLTMEAALSSKSDIYSLGITLYEAVTEDNPFSSDRPSVGMFRQVNLVPPPLCDFSSNFTTYFSGIVQSMLEKNPDNRPSTKELVESFGLLLDYLRQSQSSAGQPRATDGEEQNKNFRNIKLPTQQDHLPVDEEEQDVEEVKSIDNIEKMRRRLDRMDIFRRKKLAGQQKGGRFIDMIGLKLGVQWRKAILVAFLALFSVAVGWLVSWFIFSSTGETKYEGPKAVVTCRNCGETEHRRMHNIDNYKCLRCKGKLGFSIKCRKCGKVFALPQIKDSDKMNAAELDQAQTEKYRCPKCGSAEIAPNEN